MVIASVAVHGAISLEFYGMEQFVWFPYGFAWTNDGEFFLCGPAFEWKLNRPVSWYEYLVNSFATS